MKFTLLTLSILTSLMVAAQKVTLDPNISPALFKYNDQITVTYDVTGTALANLTDVWIWVWVPNTTINAPTNINPATSAISVAKFTKSSANGKTLFTITFKPSDFFASDISAQTQLGILLKGQDWANGQTTDYLSTFWDGSFQIKLTAPTQQPLFVSNGDKIDVEASASVLADFTLTVDNVLVQGASQTGVQNFSYNLTASNSSSFHTVTITASASGKTSSTSFTYNLHQTSPSAARPKGIIDGINYNSTDPSKVTLSFWAPGKTSVYAFGDFSDWNVLPSNLMNKDGEHFWVELPGLTSGTEYAFQYLVDEKLKIADPYSDKILEPDDNLIPATTYPNLKQIPAKALNSDWYNNRFSVLQTGQTSYQWQTTNYQKPAKEKLVIYELLIRDFFDASHRNFQGLIDTLSYFKRLGINAIELMPITEFNGEIGWGYNPTFMFATEKYYGTKDKLKEFVDKCHANGIAVIMDLVMNHQDLPNSYAMLEYDFANGHPTSANKWFNVTATHPYSVFNDLNHESKYTQKYLDTINYHWISEYKVDGYRYDLSKGFTQTNNPSDVNAWGAYDQSRINILERMADALWAKFPDAYIILEHFAANSEETVLANYKASEGKGMMLWENFNNAYNQNTMGFGSSADISGMFYGNKGWNSPRAIGYMESHDEERLMYKNLQYGNVSGSYSVKDISTALARMKAAATMFYTIPGPKMLWQFGELGYDFSINTCTDATVNSNCRLDAKPVKWTYQSDANRLSLWKHIALLLKLRNQYSVFQTTDVTITSGDGLVKQIGLKNSPFKTSPSSTNEMNAHLIANFDVSTQMASVNFSHTGTWYDYLNGNVALNVTTIPYTLSLTAGDYHLFTDFKLDATTTVTGFEPNINNDLAIYPNPTSGIIHVESESAELTVSASSLLGQSIQLKKLDRNTWDAGSLTAGFYMLQIKDGTKTYVTKIIKN